MLEIKCPKCGIVRLRSNVPIRLNPPECHYCALGDKPPKIYILNGTMEIKDEK